MSNDDYFVKCRKHGDKRFRFLTPRGKLNMLRVHAARVTKNEAIAWVTQLIADNPGYEFKAVPTTPGKHDG